MVNAHEDVVIIHTMAQQINDILEKLSIIVIRVTLANFEQLCHTVTNCVRRSGEIDRRAKRRAILSPKLAV